MAQTHEILILRDDALSLTASNRAYHQTPPMQSFSPLKTSFIPCIVVAVEPPLFAVAKKPHNSLP